MKSRFAVLAALLVFVLTACSLADDITPPPGYQPPTPAPTLSVTLPTSAPDVAAGAAIYAEECAACHGERGLGDGPMAGQLQNKPAALAAPEVARAATPAGWYALITEGRMDKFMPPFSKKLDDQQRWQVTAYALSLGATAEEIQAGKAVFEAGCTQCHGADGSGSPQANFSSPAQMANRSLNDLMGVVAAGRGTMPAFKGQLSEAELLSASVYVRSLAFGFASPSSAAVATPAATTAVAEITPGAETTPAAAGTPAAALGKISGQVKSSAGAALPSGLKAVLHVFEHDAATQQFNEVQTLETPVGADGVYTFADLSMPQDRAFYVSVDYSGQTYESDPAIPSQDGLSNYDLPITVYETTSDTAALVIKQAHIILDYSKPEVVQVVEFLIISNNGSQTITAAEKGGPVVQVALPEGYTNLQFEQGALGERFLQTSDGFADTFPVTPGAAQYQLVFAFDLPMPKAGLFGSPRLEFSQPQKISAEAVSILVPEGLTLNVDGFALGQTQDMGSGAKYQVYTGPALAAGTVLKVSVTGTPSAAAQPATGATSQNQAIVYGVGALGLILILIGGWLYWRDRHQTAAENEADLDEAEAPAEATDDLLDAIVALDDQFKAGKIPEAAYQQRRAELKDKLKARL